MATRNKGIIAYGTQADRDKLAVLAHLLQCSGSEALISMIRERYAAVVGDTDPQIILNHHE